MERMFAGIIAASVLGVVLFYAVDVAERWLLPWHRPVHPEQAMG
jgi:ABC-type nitrate/sulfonate/bicarbonate transport system permease component